MRFIKRAGSCHKRGRSAIAPTALQQCVQRGRLCGLQATSTPCAHNDFSCRRDPRPPACARGRAAMPRVAASRARLVSLRQAPSGSHRRQPRSVAQSARRRPKRARTAAGKSRRGWPPGLAASSRSSGPAQRGIRAWFFPASGRRSPRSAGPARARPAATDLISADTRRASPRNKDEGGETAMIAVATLWLLCLGLFLDLAADAPTLDDK